MRYDVVNKIYDNSKILLWYPRARRALRPLRELPDGEISFVFKLQLKLLTHPLIHTHTQTHTTYTRMYGGGVVQFQIHSIG